MTLTLRTIGLYLLVAIAPLLLGQFPSPILTTAIYESFAHFLMYVPAAVLAGVGFMGWKLNQTRILIGALYYLGIYYALSNSDFFLPFGVTQLEGWSVVRLSLPLAFIPIFWLKECRMLTRRSLLRIFLPLLPFLLLLSMANWSPGYFSAITSWRIDALPAFIRIPHFTFISILLFGLMSALLPEPRIKSFLIALTVTLIPWLTAIDVRLHPSDAMPNSADNLHVALAFLAVSGILLHAIFTMYWQRVYIDELTGIPNRRALDERLHRLSGTYTVAMIDIDHFKSFNDEFGHEEGDNVLRLVAQHLRRELGDRAYRYGGEEFCAVLEDLLPETAFHMADMARANMQQRPFRVRAAVPRRKLGAGHREKTDTGAAQSVHITISVGLAGPQQANETPDEVIKRADEALYKAKGAGRNRVVQA